VIENKPHHAEGLVNPKIHANFFEKSNFFYCIRSKTVWGVFHCLQNVKIAEKSFLINFCQFLPILATRFEKRLICTNLYTEKE
jgi:hypothetical protein